MKKWYGIFYEKWYHFKYHKLCIILKIICNMNNLKIGDSLIICDKEFYIVESTFANICESCYCNELNMMPNPEIDAITFCGLVNDIIPNCKINNTNVNVVTKERYVYYLKEKISRHKEAIKKLNVYYLKGKISRHKEAIKKLNDTINDLNDK